MTDKDKSFLLIYDDREYTSNDIIPFVGRRRYGDVIVKRKKIRQHMLGAVPEWAKANIHVISENIDLINLRAHLEDIDEEIALFVVSSRAGINQLDKFVQLIERLPYANDNFTDRRYKPLLCFFKNSRSLLKKWEYFLGAPIHAWEDPWNDVEMLTAVKPLDLSVVHDFLHYIAGSTEARHFNSMSIGTYYYTKRSEDVNKMEAEYKYYNLVPEKMRTWLVQPFDFESDQKSAAYKMMRFYLADAALQWVHGAFNLESFTHFIERLMFFFRERTVKECDKAISAKAAQELILQKLDKRYDMLMSLPEGKKINTIVTSTNPELEVKTQIDRLKRLYDKYEQGFATGQLVVGHGDPCFSNILYDQQRFLLKLIDPKGAKYEEELWTHPFYDLSKVSHSVLGNYDFVNNSLFDLSLDEKNEIRLRTKADKLSKLKQVFLDKLEENGYDWRLIRLGEASLFLSMLPLHIDNPKKVTAFILIAKQILDEIENDRK